MTDLNQSIRLHSGADYPADEPEAKLSWRWKLIWALAIAGLGIVAGVVWAAIQINS